MPEMIKYLTKKFSSHSLTEVKPAKKWTYTGTSSRASELESVRRSSTDKTPEEEEDEEISSINRNSVNYRGGGGGGGGGGGSQKVSPKQMDQEPDSSTVLHPPKHITPPLRQFDMRLPDIEISERSTQYCPAIKPKKHVPATSRSSVRRVAALTAADQEPVNPVTRSSAFVRIPIIGTAKLHPRSDRLRSGSERRIALTSAPRTDHDTTSSPTACSMSDSEVASEERPEKHVTGAAVGSNTTSVTQGKKSPTPSLSLLERSSALPHRILSTPSPSHRFSPRTSPPLQPRTSPPLQPRTSPPLQPRTSPPLQPLKLLRSTPSPTTDQHLTTPRVPTPPKFEYRCFTSIVSPADTETEKLTSMLLEKDFVPILSKDERRRREEEERSRSVPLDKLLKLSSDPPKRVTGWSKGDVEMVDSTSGSPDSSNGGPSHGMSERAAFHKDRLNAAYSKDLKRKYSVMPVDEEVRNICAATSKSNFKAFILTSNPSQSGPHHRTIDISVVQPNKRVCCTEGTSPPLPRRPSINVEKMAQTVLLRRPVCRKAGNSTRVWSTRSEEPRIRPVAIRPTTRPVQIIQQPAD